jgi:hypothetical protein
MVNVSDHEPAGHRTLVDVLPPTNESQFKFTSSETDPVEVVPVIVVWRPLPMRSSNVEPLNVSVFVITNGDQDCKKLERGSRGLHKFCGRATCVIHSSKK